MNVTDSTPAAADEAIARLARALGYSVGSLHGTGETFERRGRYSDGARGSAEVCLEDAQACRERGAWHHATVRALRGLAHLRD